MSNRSNQYDAQDAYEQVRLAYSRKPLSGWKKIRLIVVCILFFIVLAGSILEAKVGDTFVFTYANEYRDLIPLLFASLFVMFTPLIYFGFKNGSLGHRYPTWFVRWLIMFPVTVSVMAGIVIIAPLGWIALHGKLTGASVIDVPGQIIEVGERSTNARASCPFDGQLRIQQATAKICLEKVLKGTASPGSLVTIAGKQSALGIFIEEMRLDRNQNQVGQKTR